MNAAGGGRLHRRLAAASVPPQAAAFARQVVSQAAPAGRDRAKNLLWAAGKLACYGIGLGLEPVAAGAAAPVGDRAVHRARAGPVRAGPPDAAHEPAVPGPRGGAAPGTRRTRRCPASAPRPRTRRRRSAASWRWPPRSPRRRGGCGPQRWSASGAGAGLIRADLRAVRGTDIIAALRRRHRDRPRRPRAAGGAGAGPLPPAAARRRRRSPASELLTGGTDPARHNITQPADPVAGRRRRAAARWTPPGCAPPGWPMPRS